MTTPNAELNAEADDLHCRGECASTYDEDSGDVIDDGGDCDHCNCCCPCLGCEYGPRNGMQLTAEQRAPIAGVTFDDIPPNAGSAS